MAVDAVLENGHRVSIANGRLQVVADDATIVDVNVDDVEDVAFVRAPNVAYPGTLTVTTKDGETHTIRVHEDSAPLFVAHLRERHGPKPSTPSGVVYRADATDED